MGRPKSTNNDLPPRMTAVRKASKTYFFYDCGMDSPTGVRYLPLGGDKEAAIEEWVRIESARAGGEQWHPDSDPGGDEVSLQAITDAAKLPVFGRPGVGVYLLIESGQVVYVGSSTNVLLRLAQHESKEFDSVAVIDCQERDRIALERAYIRAYKPPLNTAHITPWRR